jgi:acetylornithine deacetylase/succinyl-diaminopimelate desuccinylase-like protein
MIDQATRDRVLAAVNAERVLATAVRLCEVASPTGEAGRAADRLAEMLVSDGFPVERPVADWPAAPAVAARLNSGRPGRTLQFNGHLDVVHLPFSPPRVEGGILRGSGVADMKGGVAAAVEAMRALRDGGAPAAGSILLTAHDHHEGPWGDGRQLAALIDAGYVGDGVLLPEYLCDRLPLVGRGLAILRVRVARTGEPVHEVFRPTGQPDVLAAGCDVVRSLKALDARLARAPHPEAGPGTAFVGKLVSGEIFNQSPVECWIEGTRRWLPGETAAAVEAEYRALLAGMARETGTTIEGEFLQQRDAFAVPADDPLVAAFQEAYAAVAGAPLATGAKPFVDDGNTFVARARVPAITHGPDARGAHTTAEWVPVAELARVARVYALTALAFCGEGGSGA